MKKHANHVYEFAIVGSGLSGLLMAAQLSRCTDDIVLIEANDHIGGVNRPIDLPGVGKVNNGIRLLPYIESLMPLLQNFNSFLGEKVFGAVVESPPITYENGTLKPFLGFGDSPPDFYKDLNYFCSNQHIELLIAPSQWPELLFKKFRGDFLPRSYVTKFHRPEGQEDANHLNHLTINGSKNLLAKRFIFCGSLKDLILLLPKGILSARAQSKMSKDTYWTALCLDLVHSKTISDSTAIHILNGTTQDEIGPCAGWFLPPLPPADASTNSLATESTEGTSPNLLALNCVQGSQWITFVDDFTSEDSEVVANALKKIKRQIKRAYPTALDQLKHERIMVAPAISGNGDLKLTSQLALPSLGNLYVASGAMSEYPNLWGTLVQMTKLAEILMPLLSVAEEVPKTPNSSSVFENSDCSP